MACNQMQNPPYIPSQVFYHHYTSRLKMLVDGCDDVTNDEGARDDDDNDSFGHVSTLLFMSSRSFAAGPAPSYRHDAITTKTDDNSFIHCK